MNKALAWFFVNLIPKPLNGIFLPESQALWNIFLPLFFQENVYKTNKRYIASIGDWPVDQCGFRTSSLPND